MNLIAIDPGTKTLGIATGSTLTGVATPRTVINRKKFTADASKIFDIIDEYGATAIVMGLPLNMDGSAGCRVQSTKTFASNLQALNLQKDRPDIPIHFQDERLSSQAVERAMRDEGDLSAQNAQNGWMH